MLTSLDFLLFIIIGCLILLSILLGLFVADVVERKGWAVWGAFTFIVIAIIAFVLAIFKIRALEPSWLLNGSIKSDELQLIKSDQFINNY